MNKALVICLPLLLSAASCKHDDARNESDDALHGVTIMAFNVQNLFDNVDDPGKDDKAYLPIEAKQNDAHIAECNEIERRSWREECLYLDWDDDAIGHKLGVLAEAIKQVDGGRGADIIALQEVENIRILERLRNEHLGNLGYAPAILIEGDDDRGIDVAFLSKLPLHEPAVLHPLKLVGDAEGSGDTRGILEATFELPDGQLLTGYSVHFPAPYHPTEMRIQAYEHLQNIRSRQPAERSLFAAGDFNTTSGEDSEKSMLDRFARPHWIVSNDLCNACDGTHYYARGESWSFLDMILFSPARGAKTTWRIRADSAEIANQTAAQVTRDGKPNRYRSAERTGVSDHWPIVLTIEPTIKQ